MDGSRYNALQCLILLIQAVRVAHSESLPAPGLPVREDADIVPIQEASDQVFDFVVDLGLAALLGEDLIKDEPSILSALFVLTDFDLLRVRNYKLAFDLLEFFWRASIRLVIIGQNRARPNENSYVALVLEIAIE